MTLFFLLVSPLVFTRVGRREECSASSGCSMSSIICLCLSSELFLNSTIKILQKDFGRFFLVDSLSFRNWDQITWFSAGVREELLRNMQQVLVALSACKESNNFISTWISCQLNHQHFSLFFRRHVYDSILLSSVWQSPKEIKVLTAAFSAGCVTQAVSYLLQTYQGAQNQGGLFFTGGNFTFEFLELNCLHFLHYGLLCTVEFSNLPKVWELAGWAASVLCSLPTTVFVNDLYQERRITFCCVLAVFLLENHSLFSCVFCSLPGHGSPSGSRCVISEFIRPLQISGDKPEQLSVKPTFLSKSRSGTPRCRFDSDVSLFEFFAEKVI